MYFSDTSRWKMHLFSAPFTSSFRSEPTSPLFTANFSAATVVSNLRRRKIHFLSTIYTWFHYASSLWATFIMVSFKPHYSAFSATEFAKSRRKGININAADFAFGNFSGFNNWPCNESSKLGMFQTVTLCTQNFDVRWISSEQWTRGIVKFVMSMQIFCRSASLTISNRFSFSLCSCLSQWRAFSNATFPSWIARASASFCSTFKRAVSFFSFSKVRGSKCELFFADWTSKINTFHYLVISPKPLGS